MPEPDTMYAERRVIVRHGGPGVWTGKSETLLFKILIMKRITFIMAGALLISLPAAAQQQGDVRKAEREEHRIERKTEHLERRIERKEKHLEHKVERMERHGDKAAVSEKGRRGMRRGSGHEVVKVLSDVSATPGQMVNLDFFINYDRLLIDRNEEYVITPYIVNGANSIQLRPVVFVGDKREERLERRGESATDVTPYQTVVMTREDIRETRDRLNGRSDTNTLTAPNAVKYRASFPYEPWMNGAEVILDRKTGTCNHNITTYAGDFGTLYNLAAPKVVYVIPEREEVKARTDRMTAHVTFRQDHSDIDTRVADNSDELGMMYDFTDRLMNNEDVTIDGITLTGYASPEGAYSHNNDLSKARAKSLSDKLAQKYNLSSDKVRKANVAEDWDSVSRWVAKSDLRYKTQVLDIISSTTDADARDARIRALDNGATYNKLLTQVYPGLRRTEYSVQYTVRPYTVERALVVMQTNPRHLSVDEYHRIAETYPVGSQQYSDVYSVALRHYPDDVVVNNNMAAMALSNGDTAAAREHLEKCRDYDRALNNLGILEAMEGHYNQAERHFRKAAENGSAEARYNLENLHAFNFRK